MPGSEPAKKGNACRIALNILVFLLIALLPFRIGPTAKILACIAITLIAAFQWKAATGKDASRMLKLYARSPVFLAVLCIDCLALASIFFSPDKEYSIRVFLDEFLLNTCLFASVALYSSTGSRCPLNWKKGLETANIIFLAGYLGLMLQWLLFPDHPLFMRADANICMGSIPGIVFSFGNHSRVFHGIHHVSLFLGLMIAFWSNMPERNSWKNILFIFVNFATLISTTRRAASLASLAGMLFALKKQKKDSMLLLITVTALIAGIFMAVFLAGASKYFVRENWQLMFRGNIEQARKLGGSIPLRMSTYREFSREITRHPFTPQGIGKKLIKEYHRDLVKRAGLQHGHNTLLNFAFYMGIQGAIALAMLVFVQARLFWKALQDAGSIHDRQLMLTALTFLIIFWGTNMFTDGFRHGSATLYWLFTAISTGRALMISQQSVQNGQMA